MTGREVIVKRFDVDGNLKTGIVKAAASNYFRNQEGAANVVFEGREFVIAKDSLTAAGFSSIVRGDRIDTQDAEMQECVVDVVKELQDIGGAIMGYRVTTK